MTLRIDAHQHFWRPDRGDYGWLTPDNHTLYRDFLPDDLAPLLVDAGIHGTVLVQAAPTLAETEFMLDLAASAPFVKGIVGWADFEAETAPDDIARLAGRPKLVGLRPMIQDIQPDDWMLGDALTPAFHALIEARLTFDALTFPRHLPNLRHLLDRHPDMRVVIDHGSKPLIRDGVLTGWDTDMAALARDTKAFCKLSGLVTEAAPGWSVEDLRPYVDHLLNTFGPNRLIWGSDWPVATLAATYAEWVEATDTLLAELDRPDREKILGGNAQRAYALGD